MHTVAGSFLAITSPLDRQQPHVIRVRTLGSKGELNAGHDVVLVESSDDVNRGLSEGFGSFLTIGAKREISLPEGVSHFAVPDSLAYLADGDLLAIFPGWNRFRVVYRPASHHNSFFITERCNHYCLMCSQPPREIPDQWRIPQIAECLGLIDGPPSSIGFTGGEPLLDWRPFIDLLTRFHNRLPETHLHVLTNGRAFATADVASAWAGIGHAKLSAGIPIYSSVPHIHDYVVQAKGAFDETVLGILNLKDRGQRVELRLVLQRHSIEGLYRTCEWFARNLPFVDHIALMGMENTGFAIANEDDLWVDPLDYKAELAAAVSLLGARRMPVSIYNLPLCLLADASRPYAVQSISDWKNFYYDDCDLCTAKSSCSGFFSTGRPRRSRGISPIREADTVVPGW